MEVVQFFIIFLLVCDLASAGNATNEANKNEEGRLEALERNVALLLEALESRERPIFPHKPIGFAPTNLNFL